MYDTLQNTAPLINWGAQQVPWDDTFDCVHKLYEKAAKRLYKSWAKQAIKNYFGTPPKHLTQEQWNAMSDEERLQEKS